MALLLVVAAALVLMGPMMGYGGMMGGPPGQGIGAGSWALVVFLLALAGGAIVLTLRRGATLRPQTAREGNGAGTPPSGVPSQPVAVAAEPPAPPPAPSSELEAVALRLLDRDERLLFLEIKEKGGAALQKDIGQRDGFSRSKVTRTLDRLEAKGLIVREREGMTNRVRLLTRPGGGP